MQFLTEFISHSSLEEFFLLESGNAIDVLKKWEIERKRGYSEYELSTS